MFAFIKKYIDKRKQKKAEFEEDLKHLIRIFDCGERIWRKLAWLERRNVYVEEFYDGNHTVGSDMRVELHWNELRVVITRIDTTPYFGFGCHPLFRKTSTALAEKYGDCDIEHRLWELRYYKDGIPINGLERLEGLTDLFVKDMDALYTPKTQDTANTYADKLIQNPTAKAPKQKGEKRQSSEIRQKSSNDGKSH